MCFPVIFKFYTIAAECYSVMDLDQTQAISDYEEEEEKKVEEDKANTKKKEVSNLKKKPTECRLNVRVLRCIKLT